MQDVGGAGVFGVDRVMHGADGVDRRVDAAGYQVDDLGVPCS